MRSRQIVSAAAVAARRAIHFTLLLAVAAPVATGAPVVLQNATATHTQAGFFIGQTIDGNLGGTSVVNGWAIDAGFGGAGPETAVYETQTDVGGPGGASFTFTLTQNFGSSITIGRFRLSVTADDRGSFADGLDIDGDVVASWTPLFPITALATNGAALTTQADNSILAGGPSPATTIYTVTAATDVTNITGIRLEVLEDPSLPADGPGRAGNGNLVLQELAVDALDFPDPPNADFDENGIVDGDDLPRWRMNFGTGTTHLEGNANTYLDSDVDGRDFLIWQRQLGGPGGEGTSPSTVAAAVPEPSTLCLVALSLVVVVGVLRARFPRLCSAGQPIV